MTDNIEKVVEWECHTSRKFTKWDYVYTEKFKDGQFPLYECRCCKVGRFGNKITNEREV